MITPRKPSNAPSIFGAATVLFLFPGLMHHHHYLFSINPARSTAAGNVIQSTIASTNSTTTNSSSSASAAAAVAVAAAIKERIQQGSFPSPASFNSTNNDGNGFGMSTGGGLAGRTGNELNTLMTGGLLIKDAKQINSEMESKNGRDCVRTKALIDLVTYDPYSSLSLPVPIGYCSFPIFRPQIRRIW